MKKCFSVIAALLCLISLLPTAAFAQENSTSVYGCIDLANIDEASNVEVSDIMTYDEMVAYYAESKGISLKAAQVALGAPQGDIISLESNFTVKLPMADIFGISIPFIASNWFARAALW